jgi:hypothetical protein
MHPREQTISKKWGSTSETYIKALHPPLASLQNNLPSHISWHKIQNENNNFLSRWLHWRRRLLLCMRWEPRVDCRRVLYRLWCQYEIIVRTPLVLLPHTRSDLKITWSRRRSLCLWLALSLNLKVLDNPGLVSQETPRGCNNCGVCTIGMDLN